MKTRLMATGACAMMMACGDGGGGSVPINQLGSEIGGSLCAQLFACCDSQEIMEELGFFNVTTEAECVNFYSSFVGGFLIPQIQASVDSGRLVYHGDRMADCLDVLSSMSCTEFATSYNQDTPWGGCADPFEGLVANGSACANDNECMSDYCEGDSTDQNNVTTEGTCQPFPTVGAACPDYDCAAGAYCEFGQNGGTCVATSGEGADCGGNDECSSGNCEGADPNNNVMGTCAASLRCDGP
ncbi:MAG TPA: hypothetical protein VML75_09280 [Kofleriaceae bacterium]|nr:hypothetical protein [Kofleriaceae bacterium]